MFKAQIPLEINGRSRYREAHADSNLDCHEPLLAILLKERTEESTMWRSLLICTLIVICVAPVTIVSAQMVVTHAPLQHNGASFYEHSHIGWSVHNPHYFMNFNGGGGVPPFGGYQPNAGLQGGFATGNAQFNFGFGQGATTTSSTISPVLTTTNGYPGYLFIGSQRPFVTGIVPVVGGGGGFASVPPMSPPIGPLALRMATGQLRTEHGRLSAPVLDDAGIPPAPKHAAREHLARVPARDELPPAPRPSAPTTSRDLSAAECLERAIAAEQDGKIGVARIYYQLAAARGDVLMKADVTRKLESLKAR